ncbi:MAG: CCA tRNA nucleotidyltransferase, partial [Oscillospiraceae bacterium]|nr:CCA tRNA nucleotidyltransferase [Oscillospiraceae bacterium]
MQTNRPDHILRVLTQAGYAAFYVGGCVRDTLLGRDIHDWDIATSAHPEQTMALFDRCIPTGIRHGTVTVMWEDAAFEVTTFRHDGTYLDGRRPEQVEFVDSLREDLVRRDFTVNAMAMDTDGNIFDFANGRHDLKNRILRCVGEPSVRFSEDALRMLRAYRFSAQLDFEIEPETERAIFACAEKAQFLSAERVRDEVEKTLSSPKPRTLEKMMKAGLLRGVGLAESTDLSWLERLPAGDARWAALKILLPQFDPRKLRLPNKLISLIETAAYQPQADRLFLKRHIATHGWESARITATLCGCESLLAEIEDSGDCVRLRELAVNGSDLPQFLGKELGDVLHALLEHVLKHPEDNEREKLLEMAGNIMK